MTADVFALPDRLAAKADPALIAADAAHLDRIAATLDGAVADLGARLDEARRAQGGHGQAALDRDQEIHRLSARLRSLRRYRLDLCLGRMVHESGATTYVGRLGLKDPGGEPLLVDWRSPAAEPFFAATHAHPMGLRSRRRYRWSDGTVTDYWDEVFDVPGATDGVVLDDDSAFIAGLGSSRSARMRDVLTTIAADQDAIIRADSRGALVVDGGPGTGKTVVALHRAAYLLYADPRLGPGRGGVLVVGPHRPYLDYIADVLPSLGEEGVSTCTLADLVPEGAGARPEPDPRVRALKAARAMVAAIDPAVAFYEQPPTGTLEVETPWGDVRVDAADWAEAFAAPDPGTPHNEAREAIRDALVERLSDRLVDPDADPDADPDPDPGTDGAVSRERVERALRAHPGLRDALDRAWPMIDADDLVADLWDVPAYLRLCAPWLDAEDAGRLHRSDPYGWTLADLPLLDAARRRLGDPDAARRARQQARVHADRRHRMADVVDHLVATDDSEMKLMSMLRVDDLRNALDDEAAAPDEPADPLAGPFAHVIVDEAQELTDAEWQMVLARCPSRSLTVVGDRAQARRGFSETWPERLARAGLPDVGVRPLTVNYRTPAEIMAAAEPVIRAVLPDANVPTSIRPAGAPVEYAGVADVDAILAAWLAEHADGTACVIAAEPVAVPHRVRSLTPFEAKGLEFDLVVLVEPERFGEGVAGAVDRYVAMTRATQRLVVASTP